MRSSNTLRFAIFVFSALSVSVFLAAARAQDGLLVVDAADVVLGPVVGVETYERLHPSFIFTYHQGGATALLQMETDAVIGLTFDGGNVPDLFYPTVDCSGNPVLVTVINEANGNTYPMPRVFPDGLGQLWLIDESSEPTLLVGAYRHAGDTALDNCVLLTPAQLVQGFPISLWGTLNFTPPLRVEANPFIFGDDFSSANMGAWSNY